MRDHLPLTFLRLDLRRSTALYSFICCSLSLWLLSFAASQRQLQKHKAISLKASNLHPFSLIFRGGSESKNPLSFLCVPFFQFSHVWGLTKWSLKQKRWNWDEIKIVSQGPVGRRSTTTIFALGPTTILVCVISNVLPFNSVKLRIYIFVEWRF